MNFNARRFSHRCWHLFEKDISTACRAGSPSSSFCRSSNAVSPARRSRPEIVLDKRTRIWYRMPDQNFICNSSREAEGLGPMKPGNRRKACGANSHSARALADEAKIVASLSALRREVLFCRRRKEKQNAQLFHFRIRHRGTSR